MEVDAAQAGRGQRGRGENLPVVADHQQIARQRRQPGLRVRRVDVLRVEDRRAVLVGHFAEPAGRLDRPAAMGP